MTADINKGPFFGQRHVQVLLLFTCIVVNYLAKYNASVAIVAMTNAASTNPDYPEYDWTDMQKSYIQSSFFWGYCLTQFPGGYLCRRFGSKSTLFISTFVSSFFCLFPPLCVSWGGWSIYCAIRIIQGLFQGLMFPCIHAHLAAWCPANERNRLGAIANGMECGTLVSMFLSGIIASSCIGWPGLFYVTGGMGLLWCAAWQIFSTNQPSESKLITASELNYINSTKNMTHKALEAGVVERKLSIPWRAILTSLPVWALVVARSAYSWGFDTLQAQLPSYMNNVFGMDMSANAFYSALPYLAMWIMSYVFLIISDVLLSYKIVSLTVIRKGFNTVAHWIPAVGLIVVGCLNKDQLSLAIAIMTVNVGLNAGATIGSALNTMDLSPNYAGIIMGLVNTMANVVPILTPLLVGLVVSDRSDPSQWFIIFIIASAMFSLGNLFYLIFGRMEVQPWDSLDFVQPEKATNGKMTSVTSTNLSI